MPQRLGDYSLLMAGHPGDPTSVDYWTMLKQNYLQPPLVQMQRIIDDRGIIATRNPSSAGLEPRTWGWGAEMQRWRELRHDQTVTFWAGRVVVFLPCDKYFKHLDGQDFRDIYET